MSNELKVGFLLNTKNVTRSESHFSFSGTASTPNPDRMGDIVDPEGAKFSETIPLLWQHDHSRPVGVVRLQTPTKKGIPFTATIPIIEELGSFKDKVDEAWLSVKYGLVNFVSIGFRALNGSYEYVDGGGIRFNESEILELSLATIPANQDAAIDAIKSLNHKSLAAIGINSSGDRVPTSPGVSGKKSRKPILLNK